MTQNISITTFNKGEVTPKIYERVDTDMYKPGCRIMENFIPTIYGCAERRTGTQFITILEIPVIT
jgi:hypothetical protein